MLNVAPLAGAWIEICLPLLIWTWPLMSLPLRERGLKYHSLTSITTAPASLPLRERGLKCNKIKAFEEIGRSLPLRERGLKSSIAVDTV